MFGEANTVGPLRNPSVSRAAPALYWVAMQKIMSVQILRAVAAAFVVVAHAQNWLSKSAGVPGALPDFAFLGGAAVELFFVVSGFVMVYSSERMFGRPDGPRNFYLHRLLRVVPLYWMITAAYIAASLVFPGFDRNYSIDYIAASFFFIPMQNATGALMPIVGQGWTLEYEMMFYTVFAPAVLVPRRAAVALVSGALAMAIILVRPVFSTSNIRAPRKIATSANLCESDL